MKGSNIPRLEGMIWFGDRISKSKEGIMDQASMNFWQNHSLQFLEMAVRTDRRQVLKNADGYGVRAQRKPKSLTQWATMSLPRAAERTNHSLTYQEPPRSAR